MDRLIWMAWRAFWVGLGASAVLIAQTLVPPAGNVGTPDPRFEMPAPAVGTPTPVIPAIAPAAAAPDRRTPPFLSESPRCTPSALRRC